MRARLLFVSIALLLVVVVLVVDRPVRAVLSEHWGGTDAQRDASMDVVRAVLAGREVPAAAKESLAKARSRRVYVTLHRNVQWARGEGHGATFVDSLVEAARAITVPPPADAWIKIDVVTAERKLGSTDWQDLEASFETGLDGIRAELEGKTGAALPSDMVTEGWFSPRRPARREDQKIAAWYTRGMEGKFTADRATLRLAAALGRKLTETDKPVLRRFRTHAFLAPLAGGETVRLYRGMPIETEKPTPDEIRTSALAAGQWLVNQLGPDGRFTYLYYPNRVGEEAAPRDAGYSTIRHTACAWMLYKIGSRLKKPEWVEAGRAAIRWLEPQLVTVQDGAETRVIVASAGEPRGGLGHNAMAAIAFAEMKNDLTPGEIARLKGLGRSLERMIRPDGGFYENEFEIQKRPEDKRDTLLYEHGEAFLALVMLAEAFPEETHWTDSAKISAKYQVEKFHGKRPSQGKKGKPWWMPGAYYGYYLVDQIHWQTQALDKLHALTKEDRWGRAAVAMGDAILMSGYPPQSVTMSYDGKPIGPPPRDYTGGFLLVGRVPRTTPTGSRAEGMNAARRAQARLGGDTKRFDTALVRVAAFQLRNQFDETSCYWCGDPVAAKGAFRAGMTDNEVRIDFIQHVVAGMADTLEWYGAPTSSSTSGRRR